MPEDTYDQFEEFANLLESLVINVVMWKMAENGVIPRKKEEFIDNVAIVKNDIRKLMSPDESSEPVENPK